MIRVSVGFFAILGVVSAALVIRYQSNAFLTIAILIDALVANADPPPIVEDQLAGVDFRTQIEASRKLTALLQRKFPVGTSEGTLESTLLNQGFKPLPAPSTDCLPAGQPVPSGRDFSVCPMHDANKALKYRWSSVVCSQNIIIRWSADDRHNIKLINGTYYMACL
jgi:hypothetical protein